MTTRNTTTAPQPNTATDQPDNTLSDTRSKRRKNVTELSCACCGATVVLFVKATAWCTRCGRRMTAAPHKRTKAPSNAR